MYWWLHASEVALKYESILNMDPRFNLVIRPMDLRSDGKMLLVFGDIFFLSIAMLGVTVTARKDDAPAAVQAAMANVAGMVSMSGGGGLIQTTSGCCQQRVLRLQRFGCSWRARS